MEAETHTRTSPNREAKDKHDNAQSSSNSSTVFNLNGQTIKLALQDRSLTRVRTQGEIQRVTNALGVFLIVCLVLLGSLLVRDSANLVALTAKMISSIKA